jgi:hypothetical protein
MSTLTAHVTYNMLRERKGMLERLHTEIEDFGENFPYSTQNYKRASNNAIYVRIQ